MRKIHLLQGDIAMTIKRIKDFAWIHRWKPPLSWQMKINVDGSYEYIIH